MFYNNIRYTQPPHLSGTLIFVDPNPIPRTHTQLCDPFYLRTYLINLGEGTQNVPKTSLISAITRSKDAVCHPSLTIAVPPQRSVRVELNHADLSRSSRVVLQYMMT